ncbi:hypothetical protein B0H14DRAFT_3446980 [Mycena olivaceomarginata]|nr:hypothetical protein B0H14DRAFT_3446980 [Mycena olivaceomarginata]
MAGSMVWQDMVVLGVDDTLKVASNITGYALTIAVQQLPTFYVIYCVPIFFFFSNIRCERGERSPYPRSLTSSVLVALLVLVVIVILVDFPQVIRETLP